MKRRLKFFRYSNLSLIQKPTLAKEISMDCMKYRVDHIVHFGALSGHRLRPLLPQVDARAFRYLLLIFFLILEDLRELTFDCIVRVHHHRNKQGQDNIDKDANE